LSVRYGIITPYTSFLVEETERALTNAGRQAIVQRELRVMATPAPAFGTGAVEKSISQQSLRGADTVISPATAEVKHVGEKAFVLHDGLWIDTIYEPDRMETVKVGFGTDGYFDLLSARPEWGKYLALGKHVIVVLEGRAYEVTEGDYGPVLSPVEGPVLSSVEGPVLSSVEGPVLSDVLSPSKGPVARTEPSRSEGPLELSFIVRSPEPTSTTLRQAQDSAAPASAEGQGKAICPGAALSAVLPLLGLAFAWWRR